MSNLIQTVIGICNFLSVAVQFAVQLFARDLAGSEVCIDLEVRIFSKSAKVNFIDHYFITDTLLTATA